MPTTPTVALVGAFDTKHREYDYLRERVVEAGCNTLLVDVGVLGEPGIRADVPREETAGRGGSTLEALKDAGERGTGMRVMAAGAAAVVADLAERGTVQCVLCIGGSNAAFVMARVSDALPVGFPKLLVSTMASGDTSAYVGATDLTMMNPVVDINGLNRVSRPILTNAARSAAGMAAGYRRQTAQDEPLVAISMFGVTTPCAARVDHQLAARGTESISFHANGAGGRALESLTRSGQVQAVVDMTTTELADELLGGICTAGPDRLRAAGARGIPQVVSLGALDMVNFGPPGSVPARFTGRTFYEHNPEVTLMRTSVEECHRLGTLVAERLNAGSGPRSLVVPTRGFSMISVEGAPFHDPAADAVLVQALLATLDDTVRTHVLDTHINDPEVADLMADIITGYLQEA